MSPKRAEMGHLSIKNRILGSILVVAICVSGKFLKLSVEICAPIDVPMN